MSRVFLVVMFTLRVQAMLDADVDGHVSFKEFLQGIRACAHALDAVHRCVHAELGVGAVCPPTATLHLFLTPLDNALLRYPAGCKCQIVLHLRMGNAPACVVTRVANLHRPLPCHAPALALPCTISCPHSALHKLLSSSCLTQALTLLLP